MKQICRSNMSGHYGLTAQKKLGADMHGKKRYKQVTSFKTVQDFWRIFNNLQVPSSLQHGSDYHLFKDKIEPEWEHEKHQGGGYWTYRTQSKDPRQSLDYIWFQVLLALIGNTYERCEFVTGVVVSSRKNAHR